MADYLHVELVAADRVVWSGEATMVIARSTDGDVGVLRGHAPLLAVLVPSAVQVHTVDKEEWSAVVDGGFLSVAHDRVSILSGHAEMSHEVDLEQARRDLERARQAGADTEQTEDDIRLAEARIRVAGTAS